MLAKRGHVLRVQELMHRTAGTQCIESECASVKYSCCVLIF